jgi:DNA-binding HxlR family transcriptional regulator
MVLLDVLGQRWTLRVLWELRQGPLTFRELRSRCEDVSPSVLNQRLKTLRALNLVDHDDSGYGLTRRGRELGRRLTALDRWSQAWAGDFDRPARG